MRGLDPLLDAICDERAGDALGVPLLAGLKGEVEERQGGKPPFEKRRTFRRGKLYPRQGISEGVHPNGYFCH